MSVLEDRNLYMNNTYFLGHEYGDYTPFYATIIICSVIGVFLCVLNVICCYCSRHKSYWKDRHTGNRWIQSMWVVTPHKNPPLDLSELKPGVVPTYYPRDYYPASEAGDLESAYPDSRLGTPQPQEYMELHKRESEI